MDYEVGFDLVLSARGKRVMDRHKARALKALRDAGDLDHAAKMLRTSESRLRKRLSGLRDESGRPLVTVRRGRTSLTEEGEQLLEVFEGRTDFIEEQISHRYRNPLLTVDGIVLLDEGMVAIRRRNPPFQGDLALPGGIVEYGETVEEAVVREVREETGLETLPERLVSIRSDPERDPRGHFISAVYLMRVVGGSLRSGDDAEAVTVVPFDPLPDLAFDHGDIVRDFLAGEGARRCPDLPNR